MTARVAVVQPLDVRQQHQQLDSELGRHQRRKPVVVPEHRAARALDETYREIRRTGTTDKISDRLMSFDEFNDLIGVEQRYTDDERYRT